MDGWDETVDADVVDWGGGNVGYGYEECAGGEWDQRDGGCGWKWPWGEGEREDWSGDLGRAGDGYGRALGAVIG